MRNPEWQIRTGLDRTVCCESAATLPKLALVKGSVRRMRAAMRPARAGQAVCSLLVPLFFMAAAGAEPARSPGRPAPRNAEADAATYDRCLKLAKQDPAAG